MRYAPGMATILLEERLAQSLEQQAATAEVLRIIRTSPTKLQRVLEVIVFRSKPTASAVGYVLPFPLQLTWILGCTSAWTR